MKCLLAIFRAALFYAGFVALTVSASIVTCLLFFLPFKLLQRIATTGNYLVMQWLRLTCNIKIVVSGTENIPSGACVILSNHQSTWEAFYMQWFFQPACFILKRELLWIPFFGWALFLMRPIAIKRSRPASAIRYVIKEGSKRLLAGNRVVIYPEGTRVTSGQLGEFKTSGAALAKQAQVPVLPVAHNSGEHWKRSSFLKKPGIIYLKIGPVIDTEPYSTREITENARDWIANSLK
ncbi:MAG: 1-acyl-sn-glycerol-3-phosphate acyltransferase [Cellvibrionales bacterium UBA7375]|nr:MAG: 1-acyl-sn-glycerol-3-phosphate acyltransferase [Cellvibrionales bacterium UBA7375]|tara:strand:- start:1131 stop:1838 length:708 start_codon:yes stop_codon:yes gene_type:complete